MDDLDYLADVRTDGVEGGSIRDNVHTVCIMFVRGWLVRSIVELSSAFDSHTDSVQMSGLLARAPGFAFFLRSPELTFGLCRKKGEAGGGRDY